MAHDRRPISRMGSPQSDIATVITAQDGCRLTGNEIEELKDRNGSGPTRHGRNLNDSCQPETDFEDKPVNLCSSRKLTADNASSPRVCGAALSTGTQTAAVQGQRSLQLLHTVRIRSSVALQPIPTARAPFPPYPAAAGRTHESAGPRALPAGHRPPAWPGRAQRTRPVSRRRGVWRRA